MLLFQQTLPGLAVLATETRYAVGSVGEQMAVQLFEQAGYGVVRCRNRSRRGDLLVIDKYTGEIFRVEVKTARPGKDGYYRYTLVKDGHSDHRDSQFVLLIALLRSGYPLYFLIPVSVIAARRSLKMHASFDAYPSNWLPYRVSERLQLEVK